MTSIEELATYFPGYRRDKQTIKLMLKKGQVTVFYEDGSELTLIAPVQVQDFPVPDQYVYQWFKQLRKDDTTVTRYSYREKDYLQDVLDQIMAPVSLDA